MNLREIETLRTKEELLNSFEQRGQTITEEEIDQLKKSYEESQKINGALTLEQLDDVAGGGSSTVFIFKPKGHDFSVERYRDPEGKSLLLQTRDGKNSVTIGDYEVAIQVSQNICTIKSDASLQAELPKVKGKIHITGNQLVDYLDEYHPGMLDAIKDAYGILKEESLPSRKTEGNPVKGCWRVIPVGSLQYAIDGLNNLFSRSMEGFNFNEPYQVCHTHGKTVEQNIHPLHVKAVKDKLKFFISYNWDLSSTEIAEQFLAANENNGPDLPIIHDLVSDLTSIEIEKSFARDHRLSGLIKVGASICETYDEFIADLEARVAIGYESKAVVTELSKKDLIREDIKANNQHFRDWNGEHFTYEKYFNLQRKLLMDRRARRTNLDG